MCTCFIEIDKYSLLERDSAHIHIYTHMHTHMLTHIPSLLRRLHAHSCEGNHVLCERAWAEVCGSMLP
jgi:hypothetical protein